MKPSSMHSFIKNDPLKFAHSRSCEVPDTLRRNLRRPALVSATLSRFENVLLQQCHAPPFSSDAKAILTNSAQAALQDGTHDSCRVNLLKVNFLQREVICCPGRGNFSFAPMADGIP
jgi:hypothetical protein